MSEAMWRRLTSATGGMALALLLVAVVVQRAAAEPVTRCSHCMSVADRESGPGCVAKHYPQGQAIRGCMFFYMQQKCYIDSQECPDTEILGQKDCGSGDCRDTGGLPQGYCENDGDAGTICTNDCWSRGCNSDSGRCTDMQVEPPRPGQRGYGNSLCNSKCGCQ